VLGDVSPLIGSVARLIFALIATHLSLEIVSSAIFWLSCMSPSHSCYESSESGGPVKGLAVFPAMLRSIAHDYFFFDDIVIVIGIFVATSASVLALRPKLAPIATLRRTTIAVLIGAACGYVVTLGFSAYRLGNIDWMLRYPADLAPIVIAGAVCGVLCMLATKHVA
jgi:hypothetical protein